VEHAETRIVPFSTPKMLPAPMVRISEGSMRRHEIIYSAKRINGPAAPAFSTRRSALRKISCTSKNRAARMSRSAPATSRAIFPGEMTRMRSDSGVFDFKSGSSSFY